ncbi:hypothetical protein OS122_17305 [Mycolicibacterium mucogenicum]|jgi:hypothetical protein|uniref:hypothetical protein n=1 Tax=Mycolicibacterium TaxID=1866885 RepID=UPI00226A238B|nr:MULTISPECIES: hypothetical protein [Mycolicibacterium]MCX8562650.1 hypothetical protein [Mycolicibacterium mucogenicum]
MLSPTTDRFRDDDPSVHEAARFGLVMGSLGVGFMVLAAIWVRHCHGFDTTACTWVNLKPGRTVLALAGPLFLFGSGVWAFVRTYRAWRGDQVWWAWQGAGWFLLLLMSIVLTMSLPVLLF